MHNHPKHFTPKGWQMASFKFQLDKSEIGSLPTDSSNQENSTTATQEDEQIDKYLIAYYEKAEDILESHAAEACRLAQSAKEKATEKWLKTRSDNVRAAYLERQSSCY